MLTTTMLVVVPCVVGLTQPLAEARLRSASTGRKMLAAALGAPTAPREIELAALLAAEERPTEEAASIIAEIDAQIDGLAEAAQARLRLSAMLSGDAGNPETIATAVSTTLFGSSAPDDANEAYFQGSEQASYYDPRNSFLDCVLSRRQGIPTLAVIGSNGELLSAEANIKFTGPPNWNVDGEKTIRTLTAWLEAHHLLLPTGPENPGFQWPALVFAVSIGAYISQRVGGG